MRRLAHFEAQIFSYKHQQALNIAVTILHHLHLMVKKSTLQNILKFQKVKFECLHWYIRILN